MAHAPVGNRDRIDAFVFETIGTGRYIGDQIRLEGTYRPHPQWEIRAAAVHFNMREALTQVGGKSVDFFYDKLGVPLVSKPADNGTSVLSCTQL